MVGRRKGTRQTILTKQNDIQNPNDLDLGSTNITQEICHGMTHFYAMVTAVLYDLYTCH